MPAIKVRKKIAIREADKGADGKFKRDGHTAQAREHILAASIALSQGENDEAKRRIQSAQIHASHSQHKNAQQAADTLGKCVDNFDLADVNKIAAQLDKCYDLLQGIQSVLLKVKKPTNDAAIKESLSVRTKETLTFFPRFLEGTFDAEKRVADVIIIAEGLGNKRDKHLYPAQTLQECYKVFEGSQAYADHPSKFEDQNRPERSIRDLIGYYFDTRIVEVRDKATGRMVPAIGAKFKIQDGQDWVVGLIREAIEFNKKFPDKTYVGISINADGETVPYELPGVGHVNKVVKITEAFSADVVTKPARQGGFLKLVEGAAGAHTFKPQEQGMATKAEIQAAAARLEKLAEGDAVDPTELKELAKIVREANVVEAKPKAKDGDAEDQNDGGDDELQEKKDKSKEAVTDGGDGKTKESDVNGGGNLRESDMTPEQLKAKYPALFSAALKEAQAKVGDDLTKVKAQLAEAQATIALQESTKTAVKMLKESKIPEGAHAAVLNQIIGLSESEMRDAITAQEQFIESLGVKTTAVGGHGATIPLRESDKARNTNALTAGLYRED